MTTNFPGIRIYIQSTGQTGGREIGTVDRTDGVPGGGIGFGVGSSHFIRRESHAVEAQFIQCTGEIIVIGSGIGTAHKLNTSGY